MARANMDAVKKVNTAMRSVSKGEDLKEDMALLMAPNASWEHYLMPAPFSIAILGELMLISTNTDFALDKNPPKDGFRLLKWPNSFRACLAQVGHAGWDAFNEAHKNMDQIRLYATNVPVHMKQAVQILLKGADDELEEMLPVPLGSIKMAADKCLKLATSVEDRFVHVMNLTAELLEACTNAKGRYEKDIRDTEIAITVAKQHEAAVKEERKRAEEQYKEMKGQVQDANKQFKESLDKLPSGWDMIGMSVVESLANGFKSFVSAVTFQGTQKKKTSSQGASQGPSKGDEKKDLSTYKVYGQVELLKSQIGLLASAYVGRDGKLRSEKLAKGSEYTYCSQQASRIKGYIMKEMESPVKQQALSFCDRAVCICEGLECISRDFQHNPSETDAIASTILELETDVSQMAAQGKMLYSSNPMDSKAPNQAVWNPGANEDESIVSQTMKNGRFRIEQASAHLKHTQDKYDKACDRLKESSLKLGEILADLAKYDIQKVDFEKIKETLVKGIKALGEVREQWGKLVMFFQMMSNLIECALNTSLKNFLQYTEKSQQRALNGYTISSFAKDMIYQEAFEATKIAYLVTMISGAYVEVSGKYLVHRVASLGKLLAYDAEKDQHEIMQERRKLHEGCQEAQEGIQDLVMQRKLEFDQRVQRRMKKIRQEMEAALPPIPQEEKRKIEEVVQASVQKVKEVEVPTATLDADDFI